MAITYLKKAGKTSATGEQDVRDIQSYIIARTNEDRTAAAAATTK